MPGRASTHGIRQSIELKVTAIIPCYNAAPYVAEAIDSVVVQTRRVDEVLVIDDCSTDDSREIAARYALRLLQTPRNSGHAAARNLGIRAAKGDVIAWLDADDYWEPNHVETVVGLLDRHPDAAVAFSGVRRVGAQSGLWSQFPCSDGPKRILRDSFEATIVPAMSAATRKAALEQVGGFDERIRISPDFDLWLRMSRDFLFVSTDAVTSNYRWHESQISARPERQMASMWASRARFLETLYDDGELDLLRDIEDVAARLWESRLWMLWHQADMKELRAHLRTARFFSCEPALARRFRMRRLLPAKLVEAWHQLSQRKSTAAQT